MNNKPSYYLDEKQINNLYKHVRKKMKRADRLKRVRKFLREMAPLFFTLFYCTVFAVVIAVNVAIYWETESISALIVIALSIVISIIYIFLIDKPL